MRHRHASAVGAALALAGALAVIPASATLATYPGANGRILFSRFDPAIGDQDLYTANPDGSHVVQVTHVPSYCPEWSPDGKRIVFTVAEPDSVGLVVAMDADGSNATPLGTGECASWSPDGTQLVFDTSLVSPNDPGFSTSLWVMNADGSGRHQLMTPALSGFDVEPRWQPTGHLVAFTRIRKGSLGIQQEAAMTVRVDGTGPRQLTSWGLAEEHPTWSPDGARIIFNDAASNPGAHETIWSMRADGTDRHVVYQGTSSTGGVKPQYSPDGRKILFACITYGSAFGRGHTEDICTMNADGTGVVDVTNTPEYENQPAWGSAPLQ